MKHLSILISLLTVFCSALFGQEITLKNPSFEDIPKHSRTPHGWFDCGFTGETPPDILPTPGLTFSVCNWSSADPFC